MRPVVNGYLFIRVELRESGVGNRMVISVSQNFKLDFLDPGRVFRPILEISSTVSRVKGKKCLCLCLSVCMSLCGGQRNIEASFRLKTLPQWFRG